MVKVWTLKHKREFKESAIERGQTVFVVTCPSSGIGTAPGCAAPAGGVFADFTNTASHPTITTNIDYDNPANFQWKNGMMRIQDTRCYTQTLGAHLDLAYGGETAKIKVGAAYGGHGEHCRA